MPLPAVTTLPTTRRSPQTGWRWHSGLKQTGMRNLTLSAEEFAKEIEVVKEERRLRTEDQPTALTYEQFSAVAYRSLPYANPVIG